MWQTSDVRRYPDGSIDFDFYRRNASRRRRRARRVMYRKRLAAIRAHATAALAAIASLIGHVFSRRSDFHFRQQPTVTP